MKSQAWEYPRNRTHLSDWIAGAVLVVLIGSLLVSAAIVVVSFLRTGDVPDAPADTTSDRAVCEQYWEDDAESSGGMQASHDEYIDECLNQAGNYRETGNAFEEG